tara:strand:+ start:4127 stop:5044 length:918 start_codon:yes stop_codon:yes gene_type:complete
LLLKKNYEVHGIIRHVALENSTNRLSRIKHLIKKITLHPASMESFPSIYKIIQKIQPDEIYHLAAQSYVGYSFQDEFSTLNTNINGTHYVLSSVAEINKDIKFYFAASSEMFGNTNISPQKEDTPFNPRSVYGISKVAGYNLTKNYRETYNIHASSGILFNHESPRRGPEFVTRKISLGVAKIKLGLQKKIKLGNIKSKRDWGYAKDYVEAIWKILQQKNPDDYVIGTEKNYSVENFLEIAFDHVNLDYKKYIEIDKNLIRPSDINLLVANTKKAKKVLKWKHKTSFIKLVKMMVDHDIKELNKK